MLKTRIKSLDEVSVELRDHYQASDDGFELQTDVDLGFAALTHERAESRKKSERNQKLQARVKDLELALEVRDHGKALTQRERFALENARRLADLKPGSPAWQAEFEKIMAEAQPMIDAEIAENESARQKEVAELRATVEVESVKCAARRVVTRLAKSGCAEALLPHVSERIKAEWRDGKCATVFVDASGVATSELALVTELRELRPDLAPIIEGASEADKAAHARRVAETLGTKASTH